MTEQDNSLKFQSMTIERGQYGAEKGKLKAKVRCDRWDTQLNITVPDDIVMDIMRLIAPAISASVNGALLDVARDHENWVIEQDLAEQAKQIEDGVSEGQDA